MSWRILVRHRTGYSYSGPVRASYNEARMTPRSTEGQHCLETRLEITPGVTPMRYVDYWGTIVHAFDVHVPHSELAVTASAIVETAATTSVTTSLSWSELGATAVQDRFSELLSGSRYVTSEDDVMAVAADVSRAHRPVEAGQVAAQWAHDALEYQRGATEVHTTSAEARAARRGVCQDYTHLALALLRAMGLPARYVSGYLHPHKDATVGEATRGESHAWVEFWAGEWIPVDPTSLADVAERHITVARGRDYADVRPLAGIYRGPPSESLEVSVELTRLR